MTAPVKGQIITVVGEDGIERKGKFQWAKTTGSGKTEMVMVALLHSHRGSLLIRVLPEQWEF